MTGALGLLLVILIGGVLTTGLVVIVIGAGGAAGGVTGQAPPDLVQVLPQLSTPVVV